MAPGVQTVSGSAGEEGRKPSDAFIKGCLHIMHAQTRLENAIQKIGPFLHKVSVPMGGANGGTYVARYFFRDVGLGEARSSVLGGLLACDPEVLQIDSCVLGGLLAGGSPHSYQANVSCEVVRSHGSDGKTKGRGREPRESLVVFFHGLGCSKYDFVGAIDRLPKARVLALDWPCTGILETFHFQQDEAFLDNSVESNGPLSLDNMAEFAHRAIHLILEDLGFKPGTRFVLVGHSMGGKVATLYATKYTEDISALVNIEGHLHPSDPKMARKLVQQLDSEIETVSKKRRTEMSSKDDETERQTTEYKDKVMQEVFQRIQLQMLESAPDSDAIAKWMQVLKRMTSAKGFFAQARAIACEGEDRPDRLWRLFVKLANSETEQGNTTDKASSGSEYAGAPSPVKILHIYGQRNRELVSTSLDIYRGQCKGNIDIAEISQSGHFPFFDNPDEFWGVLQTWLSDKGLL